MIPIRLSLSGFTSYHDPVEVDFTGFDLACISGPNGAGKSSLLDAITFALYGKARVQSEGIINTKSKSAEVELDFEYEGQVYRVLRVNTRNKASQVDFFIQNPTPDESRPLWKSLSDHTVRGTDTRIRNTLRLEYESFVNASFFLQGKADSFATKKPAERKDILTSILGLDQWELYRKAANDKVRQARDELKIFKRDVDLMQEEIENEHNYQSDRLLNEGNLALVREKITSRQSQINLIKAEAQLLANQRHQLQTLKEQLEHANQSVNRKQAQNQQKLNTLAQYQLKIDQSEQIEHDLQSLKRLKKQVDEQDLLSERYWPLEKQRSQLQTQLQTQKTSLESELRQLSNEKKELDQNQSAAESQKIRLSELDQQISQIDDQLSVAQDYQTQLQRLHDRSQALEGENGALRSQMDEIFKRRQKMENIHAASCPMCGQDLTPSHRQELLDEFTSNGTRLADQFRLNKSELIQLRKDIEALQISQRQMQEMEKRHLSLQSQQALLRQHLDQLNQRKQAWETGKAARFAQLGDELARQSYLPETRQQLLHLETQLGALKYDQSHHSQLRRELQNQKSAEQAWQELQIARSNFDLLKGELEGIEQDLQQELKRSQELNHNYQTQAEALAKAQAQLQDSRQAELELADLRERQDVFNRRLGEIDQALAVINIQRERQKNLRKQIQELNEQIRQYNKLELAFGKDGVPAVLIDQALPELEDQANLLLDRLSDHTMSVRFTTQRPYKDSKREDMKETLDILISDGFGTRDYETYSGGEAFRINFAIRLALSRVLARRAGARLQTLVIDEGFGNQDALGRQRLIEAINIVKPDFEKILIITHIEELKDYFSNRIDVTKTPTGSQAEVILG